MHFEPASYHGTAAVVMGTVASGMGQLFLFISPPEGVRGALYFIIILRIACLELMLSLSLCSSVPKLMLLLSVFFLLLFDLPFSSFDVTKDGPFFTWFYLQMNQQCKVCGEPAAGFHFGAFTCEGCKVRSRRLSSINF